MAVSGTLPPLTNEVRKEKDDAKSGGPRKSITSAPPPTSKKPLFKFKTMAKMVKNQITWIKGMAQDAEEHLKMDVAQNQSEGQTGTLTFNVNAFRPEVQSCSKLSLKAKAILRKPSWARSEEDLKFLHRFTTRLKCFDRYSVYVRKELARVLYFEAFEKGRVVIRQGDIGFNFYFIVSGSVLVEVEEEDQSTGKKQNTVVGELDSGSAFGELALLHDARRRATIVCKEASEFLKVDRPDFDMVLRKNHEREWNDRMIHFKNHPLFSDWNPPNLNFAVEGSHIVEYPANTVILKDLTAPSDKVYFLVRGTCKVVQKVELLECASTLQPGKERLMLPPINMKGIVTEQEREKTTRRVQKWWVVRTLHPGDYFGVGEGEKGMSIISDHHSECLLVNKMVFMKHKRGKCLSMMKTETASQYPSRNMAFKSYVENMRWKEYKKSLVLEAVKNQKKFHKTTLADVPQVLLH